jgi:hypothetical protein
MKTTEAIMEILAAYDLTQSYRDAAVLVGCAPNTVARYVLARNAGELKTAPAQRSELGVLVRRHRADDSVTKAVQAILTARLVVVDDIGLLPVSPDAAEGFFRLVDAAYEKRSVAVSSNVHPAAFDELMPKTLATATVDRLLHHAHVCIASGDSVRLAQATAGKGVTPLGMPPREAGHAA